MGDVQRCGRGTGALVADTRRPDVLESRVRRLEPADRRVGCTPTEGQGVVTCIVSPVCPHLGGIVSWNDGTLLEGPATK